MQFIIDFHDHVTQEQIDNHIQSVNGTIVKTFNAFTKTYLVECMVSPQFDSTIHSHIVNDQDQPLQLLSTTIISDQTWGKRQLNGSTITVSTGDNNQWWKNYVVLGADLDQASYTIDRRGQGQVVYVLDSGCDISHSEFANRPVSNLFSFNNDFTDTNGHGTAISSVITGATIGLTDATVKAVKIFDNRFPTKQSDLLNALDAITQDFVNSGLSFAVVNCSWSISKNLFIESKLQALINMGIIIVASAGNNGLPISDVTPASMNDALTVGSYNNNLQPSNFSNYTGSNISVTNGETNHGALNGWAPGEDIYCATLNNSYGMVAGTSIAAGIHSAVLAYNIEVVRLDYICNQTFTSYMSNSSFGREGLLDLSADKYKSSRNYVSTAYDKIKVLQSGSKFGMISKANSGTWHYLRVFDPRSVTQVEVLSDLPNGFTISNIGIFKGMAEQVDNVTVQVIPLRATNIDGEIIDFNFEIITTPSSFVIGSDSTGDPVLDVKLQASVACFPSECEPIDGCNDNCPSGQLCDLNFAKVLCPDPPYTQFFCFCG